MTGPHDRPDAAELVAAVAEFLRAKVLPTSTELRYELLVAANVLDIVGRELTSPELTTQHATDLAAVGCSSEAELARRLRSGDLSHHDPAVRAVVERSVAAKLAVARPGWAGAREL